MPIYEYTCEDCKNKFETIRAVGDADKPIHCTQCGSAKTHRMISKCYAKGTGESSFSATSSRSSCGGCSGGNCAHCGH